MTESRCQCRQLDGTSSRHESTPFEIVKAVSVSALAGGYASLLRASEASTALRPTSHSRSPSVNSDPATPSLRRSADVWRTRDPQAACHVTSPLRATV